MSDKHYILYEKVLGHKGNGIHIVLWHYVVVSPFAILYMNKLKKIAISTEMLKSATNFDNQNVSI